uniref:Uncharacterized protein n=1 Tax=Spirodela intermedia TaxID=51605 RepID=A0A8S0Y7B2_SPIIN
MTYVVLKGYLYDPIHCVRPAVRSFLFFSIILVLVSYPGSVSPFFRDELLVPVLYFSLWTEEKGLRRGCTMKRSKEVNLFKIYNMDSSNAM